MRRATAIVFAALSLSAFAAFNPPKYTNSFTRAGVTYGQFGGVKSSNYVATAVNENALVGGYTGVVKRAAYASVAAQSTNSLLAVSATNIITETGPMNYRALTNAVLVAAGAKVDALENDLRDGRKDVAFAGTANYALAAGTATAADSITDDSGQYFWSDITALTNGFMSGAALGSFAATGTVARATTYGTPTRWTDATGCVWEVANYWTLHNDENEVRLTYGTKEDSIWAFGYPEETVTGRTGTMRYHLEIYDGVAELSIGEYYSDYIDDYYLYPYGNSIRVTVDYDGANYIDFGGEIDNTYAIWGITNIIGRVALTNDIPDVSGYATQQQATNAATAVADTKISTNNAAFVAAVTNCPVVIASGGGGGDGFPAGDWSDYGTLGALLAAIIAAITWLKNNQRYALHTVTLTNGAGTLLDRAVNAVSVAGATTLTLPATNPGKSRDFYIRLTVSAAGEGSAVTWTVAQGETWDAMGAPPSSFAEGKHLYRVSEVAPGVWRAWDMLALVGLEAALAAINGGVAS